MFSSSKNIESMQKLFLEFKRYIELQKEFIKLDTAEKLTVILSATITVTILLIFGVLVLFFLTFAIAYCLGNVTGSMPLGFGIIAVFNLLLCLIFYYNRKKLVYQPMAKLMVKLFISKEHGNNQPAN